jgi:hypothetical protein
MSSAPEHFSQKSLLDQSAFRRSRPVSSSTLVIPNPKAKLLDQVREVLPSFRLNGVGRAPRLSRLGAPAQTNFSLPLPILDQMCYLCPDPTSALLILKT